MRHSKIADGRGKSGRAADITGGPSLTEAVIDTIKIPQRSSLLPYSVVLSFRPEAQKALGSETTRIHRARRRRGSVAARGPRAATARRWIPQQHLASRVETVHGGIPPKPERNRLRRRPHCRDRIPPDRFFGSSAPGAMRTAMPDLDASAVAKLLGEFGQRSALRGGNPYRLAPTAGRRKTFGAFVPH